MICSFNFLIFLAVCLNISTVINIKILTNSNQQTQSYKFTSHIAAFLSVVLITEMLEICIQTSYDQNVQLILKSYLPVVYGTPLIINGENVTVICYTEVPVRAGLTVFGFLILWRWAYFQKCIVHAKLDIYVYSYVDLLITGILKDFQMK